MVWNVKKQVTEAAAPAPMSLVHGKASAVSASVITEKIGNYLHAFFQVPWNGRSIGALKPLPVR